MRLPPARRVSDRRRPARLGPPERLEGRVVLSQIVWTNRMAAGDVFTPAERAVIDRAIATWEGILVDLNNPANTFPVQFSGGINSGLELEGALGLGTAEFDGEGRPVSGTVQLDADAQGFGWYIDPDPSGSEEFGTLVTPAFLTGGTDEADLYSVVMHELAHSLGFLGTPLLAAHLSAGPGGNFTYSGAGGLTATFTPDRSHLVPQSHPDDMMNAALTAGRYQPSALDIRILADAYGYTVHLNRAPTAGPIPNRTVETGRPTSFAVPVSDPDPGETFRFSLLDGQQPPPGLTLDPQTGAFYGTPTTPGVYQLTVRVSDSGPPPLSAQASFTLTVTPGQDVYSAADDYDGDGKADPVVFEPSTATFYVSRSSAGNRAVQFGIGRNFGGTPIPVPADYDGDGKADPAVFEPSTATFYLARSSAGNVAVQFGIGSLYGGSPMPITADYDGDGKADPGVFEPSTSTFYLARSSAGNRAVQFGIGTRFGGSPMPIPADYDGDGKADPTVFEPSTATFYLARSSAGNRAVQFGIGSLYGGDPVPIPTDYDGDGKMDPAVFELSTATFYLARSSAGNRAVQFGIGTRFGGTPTPIPGDYDGDGKADPAVFEASTATFYLARSSAGNVARQFGIGSKFGGRPIVAPADYDGDGKLDPTVFEPSTATFYLARSSAGNVARQFGIGSNFGGDPIPLPQPLAVRFRRTARLG